MFGEGVCHAAKTSIATQAEGRVAGTGPWAPPPTPPAPDSLCERAHLVLWLFMQAVEQYGSMYPLGPMH